MAKNRTAGDYIRAWRKRHGLSQRDGAICLGMSAPMLCGYERGAKKPGIGMMRHFRDMCQVPLTAWEVVT